ncbi:MAG: circularly permuted type 2 ATP-grasp protein, partial [Planctomycetia bacterium]
PRGVAGLVQAVHSDKVAVANSIGSGLLESPAFLEYLPRLADELLHRDLILPNVSTWWGGRPEPLTRAVTELDDYVVLPAFSGAGGSGFDPAAGAELDPHGRQRLLDRMKQRPEQYAIQQPFVGSTCPTLIDRRLQPRHLVVRTFVTFDGDQFTVMLGGLARTTSSPTPSSLVLPNPSASKDVWVVSAGPVSQVTLLSPTGQPMELRRGANDLPSRVADDMLWLGRYVERTEGLVRLLRAVLTRLGSEADPNAIVEFPTLLSILSELGHLPADFARHRPPLWWVALDKEIQSVLFDKDRPSSLRSTTDNLHNVASSVRDRMSLDAWQILRRIQEDLASSDPKNTPLAESLLILNRLVMTLTAFSGMATESMTRTQG